MVRINGRRGHCIDPRDRGLQYGDGVFETMRIRARKIRLLEFHLDRLYLGLERLQIKGPLRAALRDELLRLASRRAQGVLKLTVTRGPGARGFRPSGRERSTRILMLNPLAERRAQEHRPVKVRMCTIRLARQPRLAGLKTLNRLESVLARAEWHDTRLWEGLMQDTEGNIVCGTMSNLFVRRGARLITPPLEQCGVAGVMRRWILANARSVSLQASERRIGWSDLKAATEVFLSNAVVGVKSVSHIEWPRRRAALRFANFEAAQRLRALLERL
jgi:4-amino-4-deoxychorismate lyase